MNKTLIKVLKLPALENFKSLKFFNYLKNVFFQTLSLIVLLIFVLSLDES